MAATRCQTFEHHLSKLLTFIIIESDTINWLDSLQHNMLGQVALTDYPPKVLRVIPWEVRNDEESYGKKL